MPELMRRGLRRLLVVSTALLLGLTALVIGALALLDEDDYRAALLWAGQRYFDATIDINGEFSWSIGEKLDVHAQDLRLYADQGRVAASIDEFSARLPLRPLLSGTVWFENLTVVGAQVDLHADTDGRSDGPRLTPAELPSIVLEETLLLDIGATYQDSGGTTHEAYVERLRVTESAHQEPVEIDGTGRVNDQAIQVSGTLGSREQLLDASLTSPLSLDIRWAKAAVQLIGTIKDPVLGRGIDVALSIEDPDLASTLALLGMPAPKLGAARVSAFLKGNFDRLRLEDLELSVQHDTQLDLQAGGNIDDLWQLTGVAIEYSGRVTDKETWQWLTGDRLPGFDSGLFRGILMDEQGRLRIAGLDIETTAPSGLRIGLQGQAGFNPITPALDSTDVDLGLTLSAPSVAALKLIVDHDLPELGAVQLESRLQGQPPELEFDHLQATVGSSDEPLFRFNGGQGRITLGDVLDVQGANIPMTASAVGPAGLSRLFGLDMPGVGRSVAQGIWKIDWPALRLEQLDTTVQLKGGSTHRITGTIAHTVGRSTSADLNFDLDTDQILSIWSDNALDDLGRLNGQVELRRQDSVWRLHRLQLDSTDTDLFAARVTAANPTRDNRPSPEMQLSLEVADPPRLLAQAGLTPWPLAAIQAAGTLTADQGHYRYLGRLEVGSTTSQANLSATFHGRRPVVRGDITIPRMTLADLGVSADQNAGADSQPTLPGAADDQARRPTAETTRLSRQPIDLAWLNHQDLDLAVEIGELRGVTLAIDDIRGQLTLDGGRLSLDMENFRYFGGTARSNYEIDARGIPAFKADLRVDDLALGVILAEFVPDTLQGGLVDLELQLQGQGQNLHAVASSLDGALDVAFENTKIPTAYVEYLSADLLGWTLGRTALSRTHANLDCGLIGLDITSGVVQSHVLLSEGPHLGVSGNLNVDFRAETIDLVLLPTQKQTLLINATPVEVRGNLYDPTVEAIPTQAAARRIGRAVLLPQVFLPLEAVTQGWRLLDRRGQSTGCTEILGRAVDEGFAFENAQPSLPN